MLGLGAQAGLAKQRLLYRLPDRLSGQLAKFEVLAGVEKALILLCAADDDHAVGAGAGGKGAGDAAALHQIVEDGGFSLGSGEHQLRHGPGCQGAVSNEKDIDGAPRDGAGLSADLRQGGGVPGAQGVHICPAGYGRCRPQVPPLLCDHDHIIQIGGGIQPRGVVRVQTEPPGRRDLVLPQGPALHGLADACPSAVAAVEGGGQVIAQAAAVGGGGQDGPGAGKGKDGGPLRTGKPVSIAQYIGSLHGSLQKA